MRLERTTSENQYFRELCALLDTDLNARYGKAQSAYDKHNKIEENRTVLVGFVDGQAVAIGCFKEYGKGAVEIKRMYVKKEYRRKGYSTALLNDLENWAKESGFCSAILETGKGQEEAISLYQKRGYEVIDNYGQYIGVQNSICMEKNLA
jgi:putative acetyltransferase